MADRARRLGPVGVARDGNREQRRGRRLPTSSCVAGPNASWSARLALSFAIADRTGAEDTSPWTTIWAGSTPMPGKSRFSATKPCLDGKRSGSVLSPEKPVSIASTGSGEREQERRRRDETHERPPHHSADERRPEAALRAGAADRPAADHGDPQRVHPVAEQAQHSGQQRQRREHRDDADEDRAEREAPQDRVGHQEHPEHREHERDAAEENGPARGRSGRHDRVDLLQPAHALLPVAREDEERVVDPEGEAHRRDHVHDEERDLERLADERRQSNRDHDRRAARAAPARGPPRPPRTRARG